MRSHFHSLLTFDFCWFSCLHAEIVCWHTRLYDMNESAHLNLQNTVSCVWVSLCIKECIKDRKCSLSLSVPVCLSFAHLMLARTHRERQREVVFWLQNPLTFRTGSSPCTPVSPGSKACPTTGKSQGCITTESPAPSNRQTCWLCGLTTFTSPTTPSCWTPRGRSWADWTCRTLSPKELRIGASAELKRLLTSLF